MRVNGLHAGYETLRPDCFVMQFPGHKDNLLPEFSVAINCLCYICANVRPRKSPGRMNPRHTLSKVLAGGVGWDGEAPRRSPSMPTPNPDQAITKHSMQDSPAWSGSSFIKSIALWMLIWWLGTRATFPKLKIKPVITTVVAYMGPTTLTKGW